MVELADIQAVYYMVAATGVLVAAIFYILNLRETNKNRKIVTSTNIMNQFHTKENGLIFLKLLQMEWSDFNDYTKKYDSRVNPENWSDRAYYWSACDMMGYQWKEGLIDIETIQDLTGERIEAIWSKFGPIIEEYRRSDFSKTSYRYFEELAKELIRRSARKEDISSSGLFNHNQPYEKVYGKKN